MHIEISSDLMLEDKYKKISSDFTKKARTLGLKTRSVKPNISKIRFNVPELKPLTLVLDAENGRFNFDFSSKPVGQPIPFLKKERWLNIVDLRSQFDYIRDRYCSSIEQIELNREYNRLLFAVEKECLKKR